MYSSTVLRIFLDQTSNIDHSLEGNGIMFAPMCKADVSGPRFSFPQQVQPMPLDVLPSPMSSCLQKQEIVQNDPVNRSSSLLPALMLLPP